MRTAHHATPSKREEGESNPSASSQEQGAQVEGHALSGQFPGSASRAGMLPRDRPLEWPEESCPQCGPTQRSRPTEWSPAYVTARAARVLIGMLERGFTTVRDVGGAEYGLAMAVEEGYLQGPRIVFGGKALSQTGGHADMRSRGRNTVESCLCSPGLGTVCDGVDEVRRAAREQIRGGAHHLKLMLSGGVASPTDRVDSTQRLHGTRNQSRA